MSTQTIKTQIVVNGVIVSESTTATIDDPTRDHSGVFRLEGRDISESVYDALWDAWNARETGAISVTIVVDGEDIILLADIPQPEHSAMHTSIVAILECETSVLDPDDAETLATVIVQHMPPVYKAAPELLIMLEGLLATAEAVDVGNAGFDSIKFRIDSGLFQKCHAAIKTAKGEQ